MAGEPTSLDVVHTHKGSCWLQIRTRGHAVHASRPEAGENAIYRMMQAIECLRSEAIPKLAAASNPVLGTSTLSVGTIHGGSKVNIVPDFCEASVDIRTIPGMNPDFVIELLRGQLPDIEIDLKRSEPLYTDPSHPLIAKASDAWVQVGRCSVVLRCGSFCGARFTCDSDRSGLHRTGSHRR
jgi:acetylornithine deacetylase/succinyl-diaminopimelate desuccinylase-like protein